MLEATRVDAAIHGSGRVRLWREAHPWPVAILSLIGATLIASAWLVFPYLVQGKKLLFQVGSDVRQEQRVLLVSRPSALLLTHPIALIAAHYAGPALNLHEEDARRRDREQVDLVDRPVGSDELEQREPPGRGRDRGAARGRSRAPPAPTGTATV